MTTKALETAWEVAREGVVVFAAERVHYINPAAATLLGIERERVVGKPLLLALRDHRLEALCRTGGEAETEVRGRWLWAKASPGVLLLWDKTHEKQRLDALEESSRTLAHEFRTPVAGMLSLLDALVEGLPNHEAQEALEMLRLEAARLSRLVEDLPLTRMPSAARTFALQDLQVRLERFVSTQLAEKHSWISWNIPHTVRANPDAVYQALLNLIDNALKYGPEGEIQVSSGENDQGVWLEVRDFGHPLEHYETLFQAGKRGMHAANVRGSGLGLSLVRRLASGWGGQAYGKPWEKGNAFGMLFPRL